MLVKEIMTTPVVTLDCEKTVFEACNMYKDRKIGCLVITCNKNTVGLVTERDLIERSICDRKDPEKTKIKEIMSTNIQTIHELAKLEGAIEIMVKNNIKKLPVIKNQQIIGIITATDISKAKPALSKRFMDSWVKPKWKD